MVTGRCSNSKDLLNKLKYSKTTIYRGVWGQGNIRGKSGSAVNRGFVWFTLCMFSPIWGKENGRGISGFAVNRGAVNRGFIVVGMIKCNIYTNNFLLLYANRSVHTECKQMYGSWNTP